MIPIERDKLEEITKYTPDDVVKYRQTSLDPFYTVECVGYIAIVHITHYEKTFDILNHSTGKMDENIPLKDIIKLVQKPHTPSIDSTGYLVEGGK